MKPRARRRRPTSIPSMSGSIQSSTIEVRLFPGHGVERLPAVVRLLDLVALVAQGGRDRVDDRGLVVDDEDPLAVARVARHAEDGGSRI